MTTEHTPPATGSGVEAGPGPQPTPDLADASGQTGGAGSSAGQPQDPGASRPALGGAAQDASEPESLDFVTFVVDGESYAFPMERVGEIIRMPDTVRVPLGPDCLEGLANLRGRVLPVLSLRVCCGLAPVEHDEATRVVVIDGETVLGFVVDRVQSVTSVEPRRVEPADALSAELDSDLLAGVIKPGDDGDGDLIKVLDVSRLVGLQFSLLKDRPGGSHSVAAEGVAGPATVASGADDDTLELVSFAVDGQEYALPIDQVKEIVQAPERVTTVPNAEPRVLGVMDLRGGLLPVISLRHIFGLEQAPLEPRNRIVVVHLPGDGETGAGVVGMVMDTVREVLRVPNGLVADLPDFMSRAGRAREVGAVCRLEDGKRLVSVLSVDRMFSGEAMRSALREAVGSGEPGAGGFGLDEGEDREMDGFGGQLSAGRAPLGEDNAQETEGDDELMVVFRLADEEYSVDVDAVQEIIRIPESLIKVPRTKPFVEGLVNLRGAVLPVVDLRTRLGLPHGARDERQRIIVLIVGGVRTGFVVDSVTEVLRVGRNATEPAPELSPEQARIISRVANLPENNRMLMMLEPEHLVSTEPVETVLPRQRDAVALVD